MADLAAYLAKRDFEATPEPSDPGAGGTLVPLYSMQMHDATRLHWDLRLEWNGVLLSWAVTRGPSLDPGDKRLAVRTEDHPLSYLDFEGTIPKGSYGAGTVMLWDIGTWRPLHDVADGLKSGHLHFTLHGRRATGSWSLVRMKGKRASDKDRENWLLIKQDDDAADAPDPVARHVTSVRSARDMGGIAKGGAAARFGPVRKKSNPSFRAPQLAQPSDRTALTGDGWYEVKLDGYRAMISLGCDGARIFTRSGKDWSDRFAPLLPALEELPAEVALIDGEIVAGGGLQGFAALQQAIEAGGPFRFYAFDLLQLNGRDLAKEGLRDRRAALEKVFADVPALGLLQLSPLIEAQPDAALDLICDAGGEGLIAKAADAPYRSGRSALWQKIKCEKRGEFIICGYLPSESRGRSFASLLLASHEDGQLVYRGKVGTGFDGAAQDLLAGLLKAREVKRTPLRARPEGVSGAVWVSPDLVAEVRYGEITPQGRLRHASFIALREDKPAEDVSMDKAPISNTPATTSKSMDSTTPQVAGIRISSAERDVFPEPRITKLQIAEYYAAVAPMILQHGADRPLSFVRLPEGLDGERFFQKHAGKGFPDAVKRMTLEESDGAEAQYMYVDTAAGLVAAAQMGTVEFHIWGARRDRLDRPDRLVFDLDPDEGLGFAEVKRAARDIRDDLATIGLESWPLVTGGKGVHVVVPLRRVAGWQTVKLFAQTFATLLAERQPERFTPSMAKARRKGRIFVDWLRNERGATAIAPFSIRARPGAPVAVPVTWAELGRLRSASGFTLAKALKRPDPQPEPARDGSITDTLIEKLAAHFDG